METGHLTKRELNRTQILDDVVGEDFFTTLYVPPFLSGGSFVLAASEDRSDQYHEAESTECMNVVALGASRAFFSAVGKDGMQQHKKGCLC